MRKNLRGDEVELGLLISTYANALSELGRSVEAEPLISEAVATLRKTLPPDNPQVVDCETSQVGILFANKKFDKAEEVARRVLAMRSNPGAVTARWQIGVAKGLIGDALRGQGKLDDALPFLIDGFEILKADPDTPRKLVVDSIERVIRLYQLKGNAAEVESWRKRLAELPAR